MLGDYRTERPKENFHNEVWWNKETVNMKEFKKDEWWKENANHKYRIDVQESEKRY